MKTLQALIEDHETWLSERVLQYALRYGYTSDASTLQQSWRAAICGFSEPILQMLKAGQWPEEVTGDPDGEVDLVTSFAMQQARHHRERGVPFDRFMGLTKYYRRTYLDLITECLSTPQKAESYQTFINQFFDRVEIGICAGWDLQSESGALRHAADANRHLTNEKNRYLTIFESLNEPILILDDDQRLINLNLAANQLFDEDAITGQAYYATPNANVLHPQFIAMIEAAEGLTEFEHVLQTRAGPRAFQVKVQRMLDVSEKFIGTVVILSDVTDFRAAQHASEAADRAKNAFLATMSHEIRTPINGILGIAELLRDAPLHGRQSEYVNALLSSGELLQDLVNDVLDYTTLEAGEGKAHPMVFSPRDMVKRVVRLSMGEAARKGLTLDLTVADTCPQAVSADSGKIQRILLNLINNAVKFTQTGTVAISLEAQQDHLTFTVQDTGPGIPETDREKVFTPFFQSSQRGTDPSVGTGLGLSICARLACLIGGDLTLEAPRGGGTLFRLTCPVVQSDALLPDPVIAASHGRALSILLVEDNPINAMVIDGFLSSDGHRIETVTDGIAALERLHADAYDIVLMDIRLKGIDGFEIIHQIRASDDPRLVGLPILVLTADQSDATARRFAQSEADAIQAKPLSRDELRRAIWRVIGGVKRQPRVGRWPVPRPDGVVLNTSVIHAHRRDIGEERTGRIVAAFTAAAMDHKAALRAAADHSDPTTVADICHGLRSGAQMLGLIQLGSMAGSAEDALRGDQGVVDLAQVTEALCTEVDTATAALRDFTAM